MILVKLHPVFPLFLWIAAARGLVEPPSNVTLQCHNLQNTLSWSYGRILPELKFKVEIFKTDGSPSVLWVNSSALSANLSEFSDPNIDYLVLVTAVIGQNESVSSKDLTYSYYMDSIVSQKCSVDLPPVDVKAHLNHTVTFHFPHPWLSYYPVKPDRPGSRKGKKRSNSEEHEFKYNVVIVGQLQHHFYCVESVCKGELPVEAQHEEHCLNITGELEKMAVKSTQLYCARPLGETSTGDNINIIYIFVGVLGVCVLAFILFLVYKKKTNPKTALPALLSIGGHKQGTAQTVPPEPVSVVRVEPSSPTPLLSNEEEPDFTHTAPPTESPVLRLRTGVTNTDEVPEEGGPQSDEGLGYMGGSILDEDEPQNDSESGYEKRPVLVKIGSGEVLQAYRS
ncbi:interferon gamma receptor 1-like [Platichthys flesus]|uniref:interferon gamma receptor 1-like n=1 Tax=Platichthys flesus TaxID=8260 RepID=UPI002DB69C48|nr:interferon gamma receptor 1-like [Platichthys flesus]